MSLRPLTPLERNICGPWNNRARHRANLPDKSTELILYCGGGFRSALAADNLNKMGYTNVWSMSGGWHAWEDARAPTG
ncbi:MAG: rhodanese-like domain-containing protein [Pyrinomonadaceae bacterium]